MPANGRRDLIRHLKVKQISQLLHSLLDVTDIFSLQPPLATQSANVNVSGYEFGICLTVHH